MAELETLENRKNIRSDELHTEFATILRGINRPEDIEFLREEILKILVQQIDNKNPH